MKDETVITAGEAVWPLLSHGGWKTTSELVRGVGGRRRVLSDGILELLDKHKIMVTDAPGSGKTMHHRTTPETRHLVGEEWYTDFQELPWTLKRTLYAKIRAAHRKGKGRRSVPFWVSSLISLDEHLARMGLCTARPRPHDQFVFPNWWRAAHKPNLKQLVSEIRGDYAFDVCFTEVIPRSWVNTVLHDRLPEGNDRCENSDLSCEVTVRKNVVILDLQSIVSLQINREMRRRARYPCRELIVGETARRLREDAPKWDMLIPFTPIKIRQGFRLFKR